MNRNVLILPLFLLMAFLGALGAFAVFESIAGDKSLDGIFLAQPIEAKPPKDVVNINCVVPPATSPVTGTIVTDAFSSSANAPSVPLDESCAQSLADLLDAGFDLADDSGGHFFTLER